MVILGQHLGHLQKDDEIKINRINKWFPRNCKQIPHKTESSDDTLNGGKWTDVDTQSKIDAADFLFRSTFFGQRFRVFREFSSVFQSIRCRRIWGEKCAVDTLMKNEVVGPPGSKSLTQFSLFFQTKITGSSLWPCRTTAHQLNTPARSTNKEKIRLLSVTSPEPQTHTHTRAATLI